MKKTIKLFFTFLFVSFTFNISNAQIENLTFDGSGSKAAAIEIVVVGTMIEFDDIRVEH